MTPPQILLPEQVKRVRGFKLRSRMTTPGEAFIRPEQCRHQRVCYNKNINRLWEDRLLEDLELAHKIVDVLSEKQAADILLLDTREVCSFADYFIIGTAESNRQLKAIVDSVSETLKQDGILPLHEEGTADSGWILLDYGSLIVHIFDTFQRDYYQLDKFWEKACIKVRVP